MCLMSGWWREAQHEDNRLGEGAKEKGTKCL